MRTYRRTALSSSALGILLSAITVLPSMTAAAGPDTFGHTSTDSNSGGPAFSFTDISTTGTQVTFFDADALPTQNSNADDGVALDISLTALNGGLGFPFYGEFKTSVNMGTNGFLHFGLNGFSDSLSNQCGATVNATEPNDAIFVLWDDLVLRNPPSTIAGGFTQSFDVCPSTQGGTGSCVIFQWNNADHFGGGIDSFDFQAILYDSGSIVMNFPGGGLANPEHGSGSTTGLKNAGGTDSIIHVCDTNNSLPDNFTVLFTAIYDKEPNNTLADASLLSAGECAFGKIAPAGDVDSWFRTGGTTGDVIFALVDTQKSTSSATSFLQVFGNDGTSLAIDDQSGFGSSSAVSGVPVPQAGRVFFQLSEFGDNNTIVPYFLVPLIVPAADKSPEVEPNEDSTSATPVLSSIVSGTVSGTDNDLFSFTAAEGDTVTAIINNDPDGNGLFTGTAVDILDTDGEKLLSSNDADVRKTGATRPVQLTSSGKFFARVTASTGSDTDYDLVIVKNCSAVCGDADLDITCDAFDNCPTDANDQADGDGDGAGDACDRCATDAQKIIPGACGCGAVDSDGNGNGIVDCLGSVDLKAQLAAQTTLLNSLKLLRKGSGRTKVRENKRIRAALKLGDANIIAFVQQFSSKIVLTDQTANLTSLRATISTAIKRVLASKSSAAFAKKKKAAAGALKTLSDLLAA